MGDRAGSSPVIRMMIWFSGMEKWMEMMESRMESGFWEIGRSLEALIFCWGNAGKQGETPDLTATVTATNNNSLWIIFRKGNSCYYVKFFSLGSLNHWKDMV